MSQFTDSLFSDNSYSQGNSQNNFVNNFTSYNKSAHHNELNNGLIWFVVILPLFGIFLENYAINYIVGIILWTVVLVLLFVICHVDCKNLEASGYDTKNLHKYIFLPPVYINKRDALFHRDSFRAIIMTIGIVTALFFNGFTQSLFLSTNKIQTIVQNTSITNLDNFSGNSDHVIGEQMKNYFGKTAKWSADKTEYGFDVVCKGIHENIGTEVHFKVSHDGFCYQGIKVEDIIVNGKKANKKIKTQLLKEIFIPETIKQSEKSSSQKTKNV